MQATELSTPPSVQAVIASDLSVDRAQLVSERVHRAGGVPAVSPI